MLPAADVIARHVATALAEDVGTGDLTALLVPSTQAARATVISRETAVLCGQAWFDACFHQIDSNVTINWEAAESDYVQTNQRLCVISGSARSLLTAERTALNFLQTLSATATTTRRYADAIAGTQTVVMDTRKTLPGLRVAQKYAVTIGGGTNQRMGLYDGILIKENHIAAAGGIAEALTAARGLGGHVPIQIEVESLAELTTALEQGANLVLLDNFSIEQLHEAVLINQGRAALEASGNITLENIRAVAETGVDRISIGAITKHIQAIDLSMRFVP